MLFPKLWPAIEGSPVGQFIAASSWAFPTLECVHVIAITTVIGTILVMDLRLIGLASTQIPVTVMSKDTLGWTWGAFVLAFITGTLLFISKATNYVVNPFFFWKLVMIGVAGVNMAIFNFITSRSVESWDADPQLPRNAKIAGGVSLSLWVLIVFLGRAIGFTLDKYYTGS